MKTEIDMKQMEKEAQEMTNVCFLTSENAQFERTEGGFIKLTFQGNTWERIQIVRLFPFTNKDEYISIRTMDAPSKEIGIIKNMKDLNKETRALLDAQIGLRYFTPIIKQIFDIKDEYGYAYFHVMTDRGECRFTINMGGDDVARLSETRLLITDLDENRFEIPDVLKLTQKEQRKLDLFL